MAKQTKEQIQNKFDAMNKKFKKLESEINDRKIMMASLQKEMYIKELELKIANYEENQ